MIIDSHVHLVAEGWVHEDFLVGMAREATASMGKATGEHPDAKELVNNLIPVLSDPTGEKLVSIMDAAGVDKSCICCLDVELATGFPGVAIEEQNRAIADASDRFPDRLISFFSIDPRRPEAVDWFSRAVEDWGMKGLKLLTTAGFHPYDESCYRLYEKCVEYGVPALIHTGSEPAPLKSRYGQPVYVDDVAADFPDLPLIMAHVAHEMWNEALLVGAVKPNVYYDFSGWQFTHSRDPAGFYRMLRHLLDVVGPWRVFFGSDGPYVTAIAPLEQWVKAIREPDLSCCPDISFTPEELEIVLGKGFARLMGLEA